MRQPRIGDHMRVVGARVITLGQRGLIYDGIVRLAEIRGDDLALGRFVDMHGLQSDHARVISCTFSLSSAELIPQKAGEQ